MIRAVADTHTLLWYLAADKRLSQKAREFIDNTAQGGGTIAVSTISLIEAVYLAERNRIPTETLPRIVAELLSPDSIFVQVPIDHRIAIVMEQVAPSEIPEMPDRIVAATALHLGVPVISRDSRIQTSSIETIW